MNKCMGCGIKLQSTDISKDGYIRNDKINNSKYCERCFRLIHYNDLKDSKIIIDNKDIVQHLNNSNKFVLFVTDLIQLNKDVIDIYKNIKVSKCMVINKIDLLPKYIKKDSIINMIRNTYGINDDIIFLSGIKSGVSILKYLERNSILKCFVAGFTNAGKSTIINSILNDNLITTSIIPNTTLNYISMKINKYNIIDCPGFNYNYIKDKGIIKSANSKKLIKPKTFILKNNEVIGINDMYYICNIGDSTSMTFYMSNDFGIKKYYKKIDMDYEIKINNNSDLIIKGLGFINIKKKVVIKTNIDSSLLEVRKSLFSEVNE